MKKILKIVLSYLALIAWMILIFYMSSQDGTLSGDTSTGLIRVILDVLGFILNMKFDDADAIAITASCGLWIRKCAHFTEYLILGLLMTNALRFTFKERKNFALILILLCFIYACSDELHQIFVPGRVGTIFDAIVDLSGSYAGVMSFILCDKYREVKFYFSELIINFI